MRFTRALLVVTLAALLTGCWLVPGQGPTRSAFNPLEQDLTAANAASLSFAWSVSVDTGPTGDPVVSPRGVHAVSDNTLATYDASTGALRWRVTRFGQAGAGLQILGPPSVSGEFVYSPRFGYRTFFPGGTDAFDARTGALQGPVGGETASVAVPSGTKIVTTKTDVVGSGFFENWLDVVDRSDPAQSWKTLLAFDEPINPTSAAVGAGRLAFSTQSTVQVYPLARPAECVEPSPGIVVCPPIWTRTLDGKATQPVLSADGATAYVGTAAGTLYALDMADGTTRWTGDVGGTRAVSAAVAVGAGRVYTPTDDGSVYGFPDGCGAPTCTHDWRSSTGSRIGVQPALAGGVLYTGSDDGSVDAFPAAGCGAPDCDPLVSLETGSRITGAPAVAFGRLHVGTADGRLITFTPGGAGTT
jgi:outer membrane protein assembly factor BamB